MTDSKRREIPDGMIFDIDGTLWDCTDAAAAGFTRVLKDAPESGRTVTGDDLKKLFGKTMDAISESLLPGCPLERRREIFAHAVEEEERAIRKFPANPYPGAKETLEFLAARMPLFIVSNGQAGYPELFLEKTGFEPLFTAHFCPTDNGKTKAGNIAHICETYGLSNAFYVGDTLLDESSAREAGTAFIHAAYGFGEAESPDLVIRSIRELTELWSF